MNVNNWLTKLLQPVRDLRQIRAEARMDARLAAFMERLAIDLKGVPERGGEVGVVVLPWPPFTLLPHFVLTLAMALRHNAGRSITFIWDDTPMGYPVEPRLHAAIGRILGSLPPGSRVVRLSEVKPTGGRVLAEGEIQALASHNVCRKFVTETPPEEAAAPLRRRLAGVMGEAADRIATVLRERRFEYVVVPGGIYWTTGLYFAVGRRLGVRVASFDCGPRHLLLSTRGVAAYLGDIPRALELLPASGDWILDEARAELQRRMEGKDTFRYQAVTARGVAEPPFGALLPLNQGHDTAAYGRHRAFHNQTDWMLETVAWILANTRETVVVRRHPVERHQKMRSQDDYQGLLLARFGGDPRVRFVDSQDPVSTYDLLPSAKVVLPHVSSVGIEAAALGKPVVTQSAGYYAGLGFVWGASTQGEYFDLLGKALAGELKVSPEQQEKALRCYLLTQCCNLFATSFTPGSIGDWLLRAPAELFGSKDVRTIVTSLDEDIPLALLLFRELAAKRAQPEQDKA